MKTRRNPAVAGQFYPANPDKLVQDVDTYLKDVALTDTLSPPKALIVPHAGYLYSGPIAASAYAHLYAIRQNIQRVVLIGPSHHVSYRGLALSHADAYRTPLGDVNIDHATQQELQAIPNVGFLDEAHEKEHSLEVQLPFLQVILNDFELIPIVAGYAEPEHVRVVLDMFQHATDTLIIISSDLSHYHDYETARQIDSQTAQAILDLDFYSLTPERACGYIGIRGLLDYAQHHTMTRYLLDLRNSGDIAGDKQRVVGYGAFLFAEAE